VSLLVPLVEADRLSFLTIYVPAFDRPAELERLLASIPYHEDVTVVVSDDSGERRFENVACGLGVSYEPRHYNLGRDMNLLRSVATCETPWLWVIGDDDWLLPGALDRVLDVIGKDDCDRIIGYSKAAVPKINVTGTMDASDLIEVIRERPSLLIAATLCSANIFRTSVLDLQAGVAHVDTYYGYAWAGLGGHRWCVLDEPIIGVGVEHVQTIPNALAHWADYLDALCDTHGVDRIPVRSARGWNFTSVETQ
jgi:hypothetical protein